MNLLPKDTRHCANQGCGAVAVLSDEQGQWCSVACREQAEQREAWRRERDEREAEHVGFEPTTDASV